MTKEEAWEILENAAWLGTNEDRVKIEEAIQTLEDIELPETCLVILDEQVNKLFNASIEED